MGLNSADIQAIIGRDGKVQLSENDVKIMLFNGEIDIAWGGENREYSIEPAQDGILLTILNNRGDRKLEVVSPYGRPGQFCFSAVEKYPESENSWNYTGNLTATIDTEGAVGNVELDYGYTPNVFWPSKVYNASTFSALLNAACDVALDRPGV